MKKLAIAALCALLCTTATASAPRPKPLFAGTTPAKPGLWKIADADTTIYLFGTIHVLPKNFRWRTATFNAAAIRADELVLEVNDLDDQAKTAKTFMTLAVSPNLPPVLERVPPEKRAALANLIAKSGLDPKILSKFETWAVAVTLASGMLRELDVSPDDGVEHLLSSQFRAAKKPVEGLETSEWQLGLFDKLPEASQRTFLIGMIEEQDDPAKELREMLTSWSSGDDKAIALTFDDEMKLSPELTEVLLRQRNANWTAWLQKRLKTPGTVLVAVGAGHLAGPESVQAMLGAKGIKVTRVQ